MTTKREPRPFSYTANAEHTDLARTRDGRNAHQVTVAVLATSKRAGADALGLTIGEFNSHAHETGNRPTIEALAAHPVGTVLLSPLDPGDTVCGQHGWIVRPDADKIAQRQRNATQANREHRAQVEQWRAEADARRDRQAETRRRSNEILAEAAQALEQLGYRPDTVKVAQDGSIMMPSEMFADMLRRAAEQAEMEGMGL